MVARAQIAEVLLAALSSDHAVDKTFELVATAGPAQRDLHALFAPLAPDTGVDGAYDTANMPLADEPPQVRADLAPDLREGAWDDPAQLVHYRVSSGFGRELTTRLLDRGDRVVGTLRRLDAVTDLAERHPDTFRAELLDVTDGKAVRNVVDRAFADLDRIDVVVSNAGYGLFGAAEELSDAQVDHIIATNLTGSIQLIRAALPHLRAQGGGRIIQLSTYGGQVAFAGNSLYHATKWGIEGFCEAVAQEVAPFGIGVTIVEPGGPDGVPVRERPGHRPDARLRRHAGAQLPADARPGQRSRSGGPRPDGRPHHRQRRHQPAPLRMMLGSQALETTLATLRGRIADFEAQAELAASTDFPPSEAQAGG